MAKLMEHSWWKNMCMNAVSEMLYKDAHYVAWVGDYANESEVYEKVWDKNVKAKGLTSTDFTLDGKYLVNHTKKMYINCDAYKECNTDDDGWCIHPLSLLTAIGNGRGGGDYYGIYSDLVGDWYLDLISVEDEAPEDYSDADYDFIET